VTTDKPSRHEREKFNYLHPPRAAPPIPRAKRRWIKWLRRQLFYTEKVDISLIVDTFYSPLADFAPNLQWDDPDPEHTILLLDLGLDPFRYRT